MSPVTPRTPASPTESPGTELKPLDFMSRPVMWTGLVSSMILMVAAMYGWSALGKQIRDRITVPQLGTLVFFVLVMVAIMLSIGYSRLWANADGVTVRNLFRVRTFSVSDIVGVRFREGDPWAFLLLREPGSDEPKRQAILAIQALEREQATHKVLKLRQWVDVQLSGGLAQPVDQQGHEAHGDAEDNHDEG